MAGTNKRAYFNVYYKWCVTLCLAHAHTIALRMLAQCTMLFPLYEIVNRIIQASSLFLFRFMCFRPKYLKCTFAFFFIFGCELIAGPQASKFTKEPVAISSEKGQDVTNMLRTNWMWLSKNFAKYLFDNTEGKRYLLHRGLVWQKCYFEFFFSRHDITALHTKIHTCQTPPHVFFAN